MTSPKNGAHAKPLPVAEMPCTPFKYGAHAKVLPVAKARAERFFEHLKAEKKRSARGYATGIRTVAMVRAERLQTAAHARSLPVAKWPCAPKIYWWVTPPRHVSFSPVPVEPAAVRRAWRAHPLARTGRSSGADRASRPALRSIQSSRLMCTIIDDWGLACTGHQSLNQPPALQVERPIGARRRAMHPRAARGRGLDRTGGMRQWSTPGAGPPLHTLRSTGFDRGHSPVTAAPGGDRPIGAEVAASIGAPITGHGISGNRRRTLFADARSIARRRFRRWTGDRSRRTTARAAAPQIGVGTVRMDRPHARTTRAAFSHIKRIFFSIYVISPLGPR